MKINKQRRAVFSDKTLFTAHEEFSLHMRLDR